MEIQQLITKWWNQSWSQRWNQNRNRKKFLEVNENESKQIPGTHCKPFFRGIPETHGKPSFRGIPETHGKPSFRGIQGSKCLHWEIRKSIIKWFNDATQGLVKKSKPFPNSVNGK